MTAHAMSGDREKSLEAGMNDHVTKPIDPNELFSALIKWIEPGEREVAEDLTTRPEVMTTESDAESLPHFPGISVQAGLSRVSGNITLYMKLLVKFFQDYSDATEQIKKALDSDDQELALRLAHTVKGVSGNLGAKNLQEVAKELEAAINQGNTDQAHALLEPFSEALSTVMVSLRAFSISVEKPAKVEMAGYVASPNDLLALLEKLEPHIHKRKPKPCKEVMQEIKDMAWPNEYSHEVLELQKLIDKYKFMDAQNILESLVLKLKDSGGTDE